MADAPILAPRPRFLTRAVDRWTDDAFFSRPDEALESTSEVLRAAGADAELWREMQRTEGVIGAAVAFRMDRASSHGAGFVAGSGDKAELYRLVAEGIWNVDYAFQVEREIAGAWACGFTVHEAIGVREFTVDGKICLGPRVIRRRAASHYGFTRDWDLVLLASGDKGTDTRFRTASVHDHRDRFKWIVSRSGDSGTPYGFAVLEDVWVDWQRLGKLWNGMMAGLLAMNGILEVSEDTLSKDAGKLSLESARSMTKVVRDALGKLGVLFSVGRFKSKVLDTKMSGDAWLNAAKEFKAEVRRRIIGSDEPQASTSTGGFARARVQVEAPEAAGRVDVRTASDNITPWVNMWLRANFPGVEIAEDELPRWVSNMGKTPTETQVAAAIAGGLPVDGAEVAKRWNVPLVIEDPEADLIMEAPAAPPVAPPPDEDDEEEEELDDDEPIEDEDPDA